MTPTRPSSSPDPGAPQALRAEHDALAERLAVRRSVDEARKGLYLGFVGLISVGLTVKLAFDRWGPLRPGVVREVPHGLPLFFLVALAVALVLLVLAVAAFRRARRLGREEGALFARYRALRASLGLDR